MKKQNVLSNEDTKVLNKGGLILINGFYYRNMAINIKIFNNNPRKIDLKYIEYNNDEEQYKNKTINDLVVHEYSEKYKVVNPELEYPMVIMKDSLLKNLTNINQPTNIYFNVQNNNSEKYINNILENNTKYIVFNAKYYKQKNKSTSAILYTGVKKINIFILFLFSVITMMFTIKLTIIYREKDIHTLRAVGASNKHILSLFINEGLILGLICCVISILIGIKNGYVNYSRYLGEQINKEKIHFIVNYSSIVVCVLIILILSITFQIIYLKNRNKSTVSDN
ncbi:ABC transporter permease [Peptostreptococcus porci]|uniref:ABC transporter permease n=1 Tax=Peptostreptococcus porci TaxID=2652282 RepID=UPI002A74A8EC|nr:FtsX-like permease family protein [Peptostreptococcus porci]MDY2795265.1 FtsX-like permease family protein [Peptostreptococcus porci]